MTDLHQIDLHKGYGPLRFGMTPEDVKEILGEPEETEKIDEGDLFQTLIWHYWCMDLSVFFDPKEDNRLTAIETDHNATLLWDTQVFQLPKEAVLSLFRDKGFDSYEEENEGGELCVSFDDACVDLYFGQDGKLSSINFGVMMDDREVITWPEGK